MKCRTNEARAKVQQLESERWTEHFWNMKTSAAYRHKFYSQPPVTMRAYPRGSRK